MRTWASWQQASFYTKADLTERNHSKNICWIKLPPNWSLCFQDIFLSQILPVLLQKHISDVTSLPLKPFLAVHNMHYRTMFSYPGRHVRTFTSRPLRIFPASPFYILVRATLYVPGTVLDFSYSMPLYMLSPLSERSSCFHLPRKFLLIKLSSNIISFVAFPGPSQNHYLPHLFLCTIVFILKRH